MLMYVHYWLSHKHLAPVCVEDADATLCTARYLPSCGVRRSVCPSVTRRYCVETAKHLLNFFRPSGSPIIIVFDPVLGTQFQRKLLQRGCKMHGGVAKFSDFRQKSPFISETIRDWPIVAMEC